jgi:hypothetical protein
MAGRIRNARLSRPSTLYRLQLVLSTDGVWVGSWRTPSDLRRKRNARPPRPSLKYRLQLALSTGRYVGGVWVGSWRTPSDLRRIEDALLLIKQYGPIHYSRVVRELARIWVFVLSHAGRAEYEGSLRACLLDERYVAGATPEQVASSIVHEATHARLARCGIEYEEELRARIEAVCLRRQRAFVAKLPGGAELQREIERSLEWYGTNTEWFSNENFRRRHNEGVDEALRYMGTSERQIKIILRLRFAIAWLRRLF